MRPAYDAVVVGAGPYGLSTAAHLRGRGLRVAVFGRTLEMWRDHMPTGMRLRSHWWATNLSDPRKDYGFERFVRESKHEKGYSSDHRDFRRFKGRDVVVIGRGQSAIEFAALLHEAGAAVQVVSRRSIKWLRPDRWNTRNTLERILAPDASIAPGWHNW